MSNAEQLAALADLHQGFGREGIEYWVFGGWAVDLHAGRITREHSDIDLAIWQHDRRRIAQLLAEAGWAHTPEPDEDGSTTYAQGIVRIEVAFLERDEGGEIYTPLRAGRAGWGEAAFEADEGELGGVRARVISLRAPRVEKSQPHDDENAAAKDRADLATLSSL